MRVSREQMAQIFELRSRGVPWRKLARMVGVDLPVLRLDVLLARRFGFLAWEA